MNTREPAITFYLNGKIDIAKQIARALHLTLGDVCSKHNEGNATLHILKRLNLIAPMIAPIATNTSGKIVSTGNVTM